MLFTPYEIRVRDFPHVHGYDTYELRAARAESPMDRSNMMGLSFSMVVIIRNLIMGLMLDDWLNWIWATFKCWLWLLYFFMIWSWPWTRFDIYITIDIYIYMQAPSLSKDFLHGIGPTCACGFERKQRNTWMFLLQGHPRIELVPTCYQWSQLSLASRGPSRIII